MLRVCEPAGAVLIGAPFAGESVHALDFVAMAVILGGVGLIAFSRERG